MNDYERGFLEAALDGEGCLSFGKIHRRQKGKERLNRNFYWDIQCYISNTNLDWLLKIQKVINGGTIFKGSRKKNPNWKDFYRLDIPQSVLKRILPEIKLVIKERHRILVLEAMRLLSDHNKWHSPNDSQLEEIYDEMKQLNHKGKMRNMD